METWQMKDEVRKAVETIRQYLYELEEEKTLDVQNILKVSDFERAVADILDGIGLKPRLLTHDFIWYAIREKTGLSTEHQLALFFDLIDSELIGMKPEEFKDNEHISGMITSENIFLRNVEYAKYDKLKQTDVMNVWKITQETIIKLHKAGHPEVCRRISSAVLRNGYAEYGSMCEDLFGSVLMRRSYPFHRLQINIRNIGDHNLSSIIKRINEMLRKTIPDPKNKRKLRQNVPVYVTATLEKNSQQRWKDTWCWLCKAQLLDSDDDYANYEEYKECRYTDAIGRALIYRYNSAAYFFESDEPTDY